MTSLLNNNIQFSVMREFKFNSTKRNRRVQQWPYSFCRAATENVVHFSIETHHFTINSENIFSPTIK